MLLSLSHPPLHLAGPTSRLRAMWFVIALICFIMSQAAIKVCFESVGGEVTSNTTLLQYIREDRQLHGTKYMCLEAGCGACIVSVVTKPGGTPISVNACMVPILTCQDWEITTIEKVGNRKDGYHPIQQEFAKQNASQCGYCTPGWIMSAYSLLKSNKKLTMLEMEQSFAGNVCRCTGYRPILETLKSYSSDYPKDSQLLDIEDLKICDRTGDVCFKESCEDKDSDWCLISKDDIVEISLNDRKKWFIVKFVSDIFQVLNKEGFDSYMLIHGNTAKAPYPISEYPNTIIDISRVEEMQTSMMDQNLIVGAGVTITTFLEILKNAAKIDCFEYLEKLAEHVELVAHIPVRNLGSLGGNLMIKHQHNEFPSDIFLLLQTVGADLTIVSSGGIKQIVSMETFLQMNMKGKVILNTMLAPLNDMYELFTYKVMPRSQNVQATVNAGFLYKLNPNNKVLKCTIAYGNLSPTFTRAEATEKFLTGKNLFDNDTLKSALRVLEKEIVATEIPPEASAKFRKSLAINLFYKGLLSLCPKSKTNPRFSSGSINIRTKRPVSQARQVYDTDSSLWPLNQPLQKVEALIQCAGEAQYTDDMPKLANEAYIAFVLTTVATGNIIKIDPTEALKYDGVITFFSAKDIPGANVYTPTDGQLFPADEELFCNGIVKYFNQPLGIIVAETQKIADDASEMVKVIYANTKLPVIDIKNAIKDYSRIILHKKAPAKEKGTDTVAKVINHENTIYGQYHFTMETMVCLAKPTEEGLEIYSSTQYADSVQTVVAKALKLDCSKIDVSVRRIGGGFGFKESKSCMTAAACALAAYKLNRPCRFVQPLKVNTRSMGKRPPCKSEWECGVNKVGAIQYSNVNVYEDHGFMVTEAIHLLIPDSINNCYDNKRWSRNVYNVITDKPSNTWFRAPGTLESIAMAEFKMERIAYELSLDPIEVRLANLDPQYNELRQMINTLKKNSDYEKRKVDVRDFNAGHRWIKRGIAMVPLRWTPMPFGIYEVVVSICHGDGTVVIVHGGIEMGQGINTKAVQICAYMLGVPVEKIQVKANTTITVPNSFVSGGSITSHNIGFGVKKCCEILNKRLAPVYAKLDNPKWEEVVTSAHKANISLIAHDSHRAEDFVPYIVYGVTAAEVEIDVLTGQCEVLRVDLLEDVGQSVNPAVDIGQIEGAFVMGLGYWTCEKLVYDQRTGELLTDRAWHYHVPQARDIPQDFRVYMRKQSYSNDAAFGSKCVGEPPICMTVVVPLAIRRAISEARLDAGIPKEQWFPIDGPYNIESICMSTSTQLEHMVFY